MTATANLQALMAVLAANPNTANSALLRWSPPTLTSPTTLHLNNTLITGSDQQINLTAGTDYIIVCDEAIVHEVRLNGGRNLKMVGGEINIPDQGASPTINRRRGMHFANQTGTVHVEGWLLHGADISEGINTEAPLATFQFQNMRVEHLIARDLVGFTDNHSDCLQPWGGAAAIRLHKFSGSSCYQGLFFKADNGAIGPVTLEEVNIFGDPTHHYLFWVHSGDAFGPIGAVDLTDVWVDIRAGYTGGLGKAVWTDIGDSDTSLRPVIATDGSGNSYATWPNRTDVVITGRVTEGTPPGGDYCPSGTPGLLYVSPGYR